MPIKLLLPSSCTFIIYLTIFFFLFTLIPDMLRFIILCISPLAYVTLCCLPSAIRVTPQLELTICTMYFPERGVKQSHKHSCTTTTFMVSLQRYVRNIYREGIRAWWRQLNYIGDAKSGRLVGMDQFWQQIFRELQRGRRSPRPTEMGRLCPTPVPCIPSAA